MTVAYINKQQEHLFPIAGSDKALEIACILSSLFLRSSPAWSESTLTGISPG